MSHQKRLEALRLNEYEIPLLKMVSTKSRAIRAHISRLLLHVQAARTTA